VMNSYWLVWWQNDTFNESTGFYMGIYAFLGVAQAIFTFFMGVISGVFTYYAAQNLHAGAITRVMYAPLNTFFDVQPKGRILNRFTKDIDTIDNTLPDSMRMAISTLGSVFGAIILISILTYYFIVAVAAVLIFYIGGSLMYQRGSREVKRLDAVLRSALYSHFSETLSGLATVRAYQETARFHSDHARYMDIENRAYFFTICNQRYLGVRLDALGALLVFVTALLATIGANSINPAQIGLALSFMLTVSQAFSWASRQVSEVLNDMNSAERIQHYANELVQEAPQEVPEANLPAEWPQRGAIEFDNITLRYREGLPIVLNGITMSIAGGEKTAIVGRTGAGKSSLLTCLLRLIELEKGCIKIDGVDVSQIGLLDLRSRIGYLPQEPILFSGTIRSNLDPFNIYDDARLNDALKRSYLVASSTEDNANHHGNANNSLSLETPLEEEGGNLSLGQRSLVSLARALVKDSQIILLDEATASVDVQTDALIQETIRKEFAHKTLLTIAHRLRTIISYDKVAVFDKGTLAEYDTPLILYDRGDIFHDMCEKANLSREEIVRAQQQQH
jgi:ABC-type multidrug transport system fused ATPase/permease subunit